MFYKQILEALRTQFPGVGDNILQKTAARLAKTVTNEEGVKTAVSGVTLQQVIDSYGDSRATEAQESAVKNYEEKHNLKDGKVINPDNGGGASSPQTTTASQTPNNGGGASEQIPAWAQALIDSNKSMSDRLNKMDNERTTATRKQQISDVISKLPEKLRKPYERMAVDTLSDDEFNTLVSEVTTEVDGIVNDTKTKGAVFGQPSAGGNGKQNEELTKEQIEAINHRAGVTKEGEQPF